MTMSRRRIFADALADARAEELAARDAAAALPRGSAAREGAEARRAALMRLVAQLKRSQHYEAFRLKKVEREEREAH
ncbi:MAG: hypothetical protein VX152_12320 [Pseudomonadota bacterium]|nr:hypothetical protein [Pseudomonadota bacterium]